MTQTADDIRDAEIAELQTRVKALEQRVAALEARPVVVPVMPSGSAPLTPAPITLPATLPAPSYERMGTAMQRLNGS